MLMPEEWDGVDGESGERSHQQLGGVIGCGTGWEVEGGGWDWYVFGRWMDVGMGKQSSHANSGRRWGQIVAIVQNLSDGL